MEKLLETVTKFPQTEVWNDSCSYRELEYAIQRGASGATTNPVIVLNVLRKEIKDWQPTIEKLIIDNPSFSEDQIAWEIIKKLGANASTLLYNQFKDSKGKKGRISFQTNAKLYNDAKAMIDHGIELSNVVDNSQIKAPTSKAGIEAFEELTYRGISINATVSFTCSQAIAVAEAVERGLNRRKAEGLSNDTMNPVCTLMVGRLDDYLKEVVKNSDYSVPVLSLEYAGIATFKHTYKLYKERKYQTKLLVAAFRNSYHWSEFIGGDVILTITNDWQRKYNGSDIEIKSNIDTEVSEEIIQDLRKIKEFSQAYDEDGLLPEEFQHYGAFIKTMNQFLSGYDELTKLIRGYMVK